MKAVLRWLVRLAVLLGIAIAAPILLLIGCQSKLIYFPRPYPAGTAAAWQSATGGKPIDFETSQGKQRAFLQGNLKAPRNLWIVFGGNATVALDWSDWLAAHAPSDDAWLLMDFPGYGDCHGSATPDRIRESISIAVPKASAALGWTGNPDPKHLRFFGHSLGAAASLIAATEFKIQRGVLMSPFTSTMDMSKQTTGLPLGFLVWHRFDNSARLTDLTARGPGKVIIIHGTEDEAISVEMGRKLAKEHPTTVRFKEIPGAGHNNLTETSTTEIAAALKEIGQ